MLKDFLDHEVGVTALLELSQGDVNLFYLGMLGLVVHVDHLQLLAQAHHGDVAVVEVNHAVGIFGNGACVRPQVVFSLFSQSHYQGRTLAGTHDGVRVVAVEDGDGIGSDDLVQCHLNCLEQVDVVAEHDVLDKLNQYLGVRHALEGNAAFHQVLLQVFQQDLFCRNLFHGHLVKPILVLVE